MFVQLLMNRLLIDTNILIYSKDSSSAFNSVALNVIQGNFKLFTTSKNLSEYYAVVTKGVNPLLTPAEALNDLQEFSALCEILYPSPVSQQKLWELITTHHPKGLKIHDLEIAAIALANRVENISTINTSDFKNIEGLKVIV